LREKLADNNLNKPENINNTKEQKIEQTINEQDDNEKKTFNYLPVN